MMSVRRVCAYAFAVLLLSSHPSLAQQTCPCPPPEPPPGNWVGSAGLGFSLNRGNKDTTNLNVTFDAAYDPKTKNSSSFRGSTSAARPMARSLSIGFSSRAATSAS